MDKKKKKRACLLGLPVDLTDINSAVETLLEQTKPLQVVTLNPEMVDKTLVDNTLADLISQADMVVPDGVGIVIALKLIGVKANRIPGIELAYKLLEKSEEQGLKVALLGADEDTIQKAKQNLLKKMPNLNLVYTRNGYFNSEEEKAVKAEIEKVNPDLLLVGLGFPKQEVLISQFKNTLKNAIMIGVGGSFDVWSGKLKRAPKMWQKLGLEWLYRTICQPERFKRIFPTIPLFLLKVMAKYNKSRKEY